MKKIFNYIGKAIFITYLTILSIATIAFIVYGVKTIFIAFMWTILETIFQDEDILLGWQITLKLTLAYITTDLFCIFSIYSGFKFLSKSNKLDLLKAFSIIPILICILYVYIYKLTWLPIF